MLRAGALVRVHPLLCLAIVVTGLGPVHGSEGGTEDPASGWRAALAAEFRAEYEKHVAAAATTITAAAESVPDADIFRGPVEPETVMLEPLVVDGAADIRRLELLIERAAVRGSADFITRHFVRTEFQRDFGKVRFGVVSIFRIPVMAGLSW
jgi:hypothetical protein